MRELLREAHRQSCERTAAIFEATAKRWLDFARQPGIGAKAQGYALGCYYRNALIAQRFRELSREV
jgi:hypothetical protein